MDLNLQNKVALVLGAGGGLGGAIADALAAEGAKVALADINKEALDAVQERVGARTATAAVQWDLGDLDSIPGHVAAIGEQLGPVDVLVNVTGGPPPTPVAGQDRMTWSRYFDAMVLSVIGITDAVLPGMRERGWGRVITSTSSGVIAPIPNLGLSNALRSSLVGWSKTLAREVGPYGITSNIVIPGRIATGRITQLDEAKASREGRTAADVSAESVASIPVGRYGTPAEYADMIAFLASPRAGYISGSTIRVDGGLIASV
ncbi:putative short-chain dehydrogenase [Streptomyces bingchenggensis BCW-1]|uniref:Putative short-chain dehydrogenase n=1 Tax=Streptomyces bingchenggensis (strain BCW-1) TaxID=749414 RepID=D7BUG9_STRBB|nr:MULTISPECIES: SDR family oxidoreductase [Streptomyces]ADI11718.1 putative short-chain dehydrogenase [Streptomyces bingchenggensis BCW-1]